MLNSSQPYRAIVRCALILLPALLAAFFTPASAQQPPTISGPICVSPGSTYNYNITAYTTGTVTYSVSGGTLSTGGSSGSHAAGQFNITVTWSSSFTSGSITVNASSGYKVLSVSASTAVSGGTITSGLSQAVNYNVIPSTTIVCSDPSGGCSTTNYVYMWQSSPDNNPSTFSDYGVTTNNLTFTSTPPATAYFRRKVTETNSGRVAYSSNSALVTVYQPLTPGTITPSSINISPGTSPGQLVGSLPGGGDGNFVYNWWSSPTNGVPWTQVGSSISYTPGILTTTMFYRRDVSDLGNTVSATAVVNVIGGVLPPTNSTGNLNADKNWVIASNYDPSGNLMAQSKQFYDNAGRTLQSQTKVFYRKDANTTYTHVFASQPVKDAYNRQVLTTMSAPIDYADFSYVSNFVQAPDGSNYTYKNFDRFNPFNSETDKTNNPDAIGGVSAKGTLGWYYSANNAWEPYTATTSFPYSRTTIYKDGTNNTKKQAAPGETFRMGSNHETGTCITPVVGEFPHYNSVRNKFFPATQVGALPSALTNAYIQVAKDANGNEVFSMLDKEGHVLITGRPGSDLSFSCNAGLTAPGAPYMTYLQSTDHLYVTPSITPIQVYVGGSLFYSGAASGFNISTLGSSWGQITCANSFTYQNCPGGNCSPVTYAYRPQSMIYFKILADNTPVSITGSGSYTLYDMNTEAATAPVSGMLNRGYYKVNCTSGSITVSYSNSLTDVSYNFYDQMGRMVASIAPEGVKKLIGSGINGYSTASSIPFISQITYDSRGRMISKTTPDEGTTQYIYRADGALRFTQNAYQATMPNGGYYSYTNYDQYGRAIESGQYQPDPSGTPFSSAASIAENTSPTGGLGSGTKTDVIMLTYDVPDQTYSPNVSTSYYLQDAANLANRLSTSKRYSQIVNNSPSSTYLVSQTWFNYNEEGQTLWTIKYVAALGTSGYKTTDYSYDGLTRLTTKTFQMHNSGEAFVHYYVYDPVNGNLSKIYTSTDISITPSNGAMLQASFIYYLHGGLKRVELSTNLQGVDYTYTLQGALKGINNSDGLASSDPGGDGANGFTADAFGETLDYFSNDYVNSRTSGAQNIRSVNPSGIPDSYIGNIKAMTWFSVKPSGLGGSNAPKTYVYNYDPKYQLIAGTWGDPNFGTTPAGFNPSTGNQEKVTIPGSGTPGTPAYDGNGNILNLQRTNAAGANLDVLAYTYTANTNKIATITNTGSPSGTYSYGYDQIGRETSENVGDPNYNKTIQYDCRGNVTLVSNSNGPVVAYVYDDADTRIQKIDYNTTTHAVSQITSYYGGVVYTQTVAGGTLTPQEYPIDGTTGRIGLYLKQSATYLYQLTDHQGNVRAVLAKSGSMQTTYDYYPFGMVYSPYVVIPYRYGYQGQTSEMDGETNWNSFQFRMYNPRIGRWIITDPQGQFYSPYIGMGNNPILLNDPNGAFIPPTLPGDYCEGQPWVDEDGMWVFHNNEWVGVGETEGVNFHIDAEDLEPTTVSWSHSLAYKIWNSDFVRHYTPDFINIGGGFSGIFATGAAPSIEFNWVLHGKEASWKPILTTTTAVGVGYSVDATLNIGVVSYSGDASKITRSMVITNTMRGDQPTYWASGGISEALKLGGTVQVTPLKEGVLIGGQFNFGLGLPAGPVPLNAAGGVSNTFLLYDFAGKLKPE